MNGLPDAATSAIGLFVTCDMKPTIEKITNPANILVKEFIQHTMIESLQKKKDSVFKCAINIFVSSESCISF